MSAAYATAMLYARHLPAADQDPAQARHWLEQALHLAAGLNDPRQRVLSTVFYEQGLALLDSRAGEPARALRLIDDGLARLTAVLAPGERPQDLARLRHNRAQVYLALGDPAAGPDRPRHRDRPRPRQLRVLRGPGRPAPGGGAVTGPRSGTTAPRSAWDRTCPRRTTTGPCFNRSGAGRAGAGRPGAGARHRARAPRRPDRPGQPALGARRVRRGRGGRAGRAGAGPAEPALLCTLGLIRSERGSLAEADELFTRALAGIRSWSRRGRTGPPSGSNAATWPPPWPTWTGRSRCRRHRCPATTGARR